MPKVTTHHHILGVLVYNILLNLNYVQLPHNNRMQPDFGELALASAADAGVMWRIPAGSKFKLNHI